MTGSHSATEDNRFLADLRGRYNRGEGFDFIFFWESQPRELALSAACFCQWYESPFEVDGQCYATAEHYMMAEKAALFGDEEIRTLILDASNPGITKALGRRIRGFNEEIWAQQRYSIVVRANAAKFSQNPALGRFLLATDKRVIVEASPADRIWGIGLARGNAKAQDPNLWRGLNLLGFALMQVREQYRAG